MLEYHQELQRIRRLSRVLLALTILLLGVLAFYAWPFVHNWFSNSSARPRAITPRGPLSGEEQETINLFKKASPSVAFITTDIRRRLGRSVQDIPAGAGSGFVWDEQNGLIVTNFHVIQNASAAHVILFDQTTYDAQILGADPEHDLAVLKIPTSITNHLTAIPVGTSADLQVGQSVLAIGNPFGLDQSLTTGVISALNRTITGVAGNPIDGVIQTDAAINPGNSGGPLIDSAGRLIGMNTAIYSPSGAWSGIGFAIPVDTVNRIVPQIIATGHATRGTIGIHTDDDLARQALGTQRVAGITGAVVVDVEPNSPADKAGITGLTRTGRGGFGARIALGDVITAINDHAVKTGADYFTAMDKVKPGESVDVTIVRNNAPQHVTMKAD